jgi:hypothetical protein
LATDADTALLALGQEIVADIVALTLPPSAGPPMLKPPPPPKAPHWATPGIPHCLPGATISGHERTQFWIAPKQPKDQDGGKDKVALASEAVHGFERVVDGKVEEVRPFERLEGDAVHEHIGVPDSLPGQSAFALAAQKQTSYHHVDTWLRAGSYAAARQTEYGYHLPPERELQRHVQAVDRAFSLARPTTKPVVVYRGMGGFLPERVAPGTRIHDDAPVSTSTDPDTARAFTEEYSRTGDLSQGRVVRITVPPGTHLLSFQQMYDQALIPGHRGQADEEHEVMLPRGQDLQVTGVHGNIIEAEMVPEHAPPPLPGTQPKAAAPKADPRARALAYKQAHAAVALSRPRSSRARRFVWRPGDVRITRMHAPMP